MDRLIVERVDGWMDGALEPAETCRVVARKAKKKKTQSGLRNRSRQVDVFC